MYDGDTVLGSATITAAAPPRSRGGMTRPWAPGAATGIGSLPGTDPDEAARAGPRRAARPAAPARAARPRRRRRHDRARARRCWSTCRSRSSPSGWRLDRPRRPRPAPRPRLPGLRPRRPRGAGRPAIRGPAEAAGRRAVDARRRASSCRTGTRCVTDPGAARDLVDSLAEGLRRAPGRRRRAGARRRARRCSSTSRRCPPCSAARVRRRRATGRCAPSTPTSSSRRCATVLGRRRAGRARRALLRRRRPDRAAARGRRRRDLARRRAARPRRTTTRSARRSTPACALWLGVLPGTDADVSLDRARAPIERLWRELGFPLDRAGRRGRARRRRAGWPARARPTCAACWRCCATSGTGSSTPGTDAGGVGRRSIG